MTEKEFSGFKKVIFAIFDDHNAGKGICLCIIYSLFMIFFIADNKQRIIHLEIFYLLLRHLMLQTSELKSTLMRFIKQRMTATIKAITTIKQMTMKSRTINTTTMMIKRIDNRTMIAMSRKMTMTTKIQMLMVMLY